MKLKLGGSTFSFLWREPALASMKRLSSIPLNDFDVLLAAGHLWFDDFGAPARRELRRMLEGEGLRIESLNLPALDFNLASVVPEVRALTVFAYKKTIALAADLGARGVVVVPGRVSGLMAPDRADSLAYLTETSIALLEAAGESNCRLFFESHPQTPVPTADALGEWVSSLHSPFALIAYDVANAEFIGEDQSAAIRRWGPLIGQYHLSDATRTAWRHDPLGKGSVDFAAIVEAIAEQPFDGAAILEIISSDPIADMQRGIDLIQSTHRAGTASRSTWA
ncbi:sugar phosphate isomerase/epimerase family protein [Chelativorans sp.]|uniref:sugar phosphate isomerase/epimerase family protein n=1 Tax=Chelativorans sp. TaxID=2203393 RepID=UPI002811ED83|nr:sugar phosphate isomerase/epimerase family protein [Chelativorans sp.]